MPKFAPVAPIHILEQLLNMGDLGHYHLFLAHHVAEYPDRFRILVHKLQSIQNTTIIMDNSIVELGGAVDDQMVWEATSVCMNAGARTIPVLPDVMGNGAETRYLSSQAYDRWVNHNMANNGYMLVAQGENWEDFTKTIDYFFGEGSLKFRHIRWVGIPRVLVKSVGSRTEALAYVRTVAPWVKVHMLGFSVNLWDDVVTCRWMPTVLAPEGIDSAVPMRYNGVLTPGTTDEMIGPRDPNWFTNGELTPQILKNLSQTRNWFGDNSTEHPTSLLNVN
jgi:hypothetical protein